MIDIGRACGHYLIVELDKVDDETVSDGGIVLATGSDNKKKEQNGEPYATVHDVGPTAWQGHYNAETGDWAAWAKPGDRVMLARYPGQTYTIPDSGITSGEKELLGRMRAIKDTDVLCVMDGSNTILIPEDGGDK